MADEIVTKAVESLSTQMDTALVEISNTLKDAVSNYGPDAVDLALVAFRIEAAQQLVVGIMFLTIVVVGWVIQQKIWKLAAALNGDSSSGDPTERGVARTVSTVAATLSTVFIGGMGMERVIDVSAWMAVLGYPEVRVAMKALAAAGLL